MVNSTSSFATISLLTSPENDLTWLLLKYSTSSASRDGTILGVGERVGDERKLMKVYEGFGDSLREHAEGFRVSILSGNMKLAQCTDLPDPKEWIDLKNGALDCRLLSWQL